MYTIYNRYIEETRVLFPLPTVQIVRLHCTVVIRSVNMCQVLSIDADGEEHPSDIVFVC